MGPFKMFAKPFPAGVNDCISAVRWVMENKSALQVTTVCTTGESGGGNLCISSAVKGAVHATEVSLPTEVPEIRNGMLDGIASFARSL